MKKKKYGENQQKLNEYKFKLELISVIFLNKTLWHLCRNNADYPHPLNLTSRVANVAVNT